jgi:ribonuclease BN (tRNA processing enzyme)
VWVDAGPCSLANLQRDTSLAGLDAIWISHLHVDHCADRLGAFYALAYWYVAGQLPSGRLFILRASEVLTQEQVVQIADQITTTP